MGIWNKCWHGGRVWGEAERSMCNTESGQEHTLTEQKSLLAHRWQSLGVGNGDNE